MPVHDWTKVPSGLFHHFHQDWTIEIARELNRGLLPRGVSALVEQRSGQKETDVLAIEAKRPGSEAGGGVATLPAPSTQIVQRADRAGYARRANRILLKHRLGRTVAVIEIVSPGNKDTQRALRNFVSKTVEFLNTGIRVLVVDVFPPTRRDPKGIHKAIWEEFSDDDFEFPSGSDRILASYDFGSEQVAYVEPFAVGDVLPDMPLYLSDDVYVMIPLESSYQATWDAAPEDFRTVVETGVLPEPENE